MQVRRESPDLDPRGRQRVGTQFSSLIEGVLKIWRQKLQVFGDNYEIITTWTQLHKPTNRNQMIRKHSRPPNLNRAKVNWMKESAPSTCEPTMPNIMVIQLSLWSNSCRTVLIVLLHQQALFTVVWQRKWGRFGVVERKSPRVGCRRTDTFIHI